MTTVRASRRIVRGTRRILSRMAPDARRGPLYFFDWVRLRVHVLRTGFNPAARDWVGRTSEESRGPNFVAKASSVNEIEYAIKEEANRRAPR
jgi:hypothetical protein